NTTKHVVTRYATQTKMTPHKNMENTQNLFLFFQINGIYFKIDLKGGLNRSPHFTSTRATANAPPHLAITIRRTCKLPPPTPTPFNPPSSLLRNPGDES